jgi:hypothetical protein
MGMAQADAGLSPPFPPAVLWLLVIGAVGVGGLASIRLLRGRRTVG